ncbi:helix-turn-helix domain-containing protein [Streptomyces tendae]|uniref:helix-turn-helix domain-containing protein n=1 Tax=Streptomyces tendae TaxID=1932 RepID=UPI003661BB42
MTQDPEPDWSARLSLSVAREVRRHRQAKGLSAQQLSERCSSLGMPIQRSVLANLESGRRTTVTIAEVLVLAAALEIPPTSLIVPVGYEEEFEALPGVRGESYDWALWVAGEEILAPANARGGDVIEARRRLAGNPLNRLRRIRRECDRYVEVFRLYSERLQGSLERIRANNRDLALYNQAMGEAESIVQKREELLNSISDEQDPEEMARASERRKLLRQEAEEAFERVAALKARVAEYRDDRQEIDAMRVIVEEGRRRIVKAVDEMKSEGWVMPDLPVDVEELRNPLSSVLE